MIEDNTFITSDITSEGIDRRSFLKLCAALAATMGLSANASAEIAASVSRKDCPPSSGYLHRSVPVALSPCSRRRTRPSKISSLI